MNISAVIGLGFGDEGKGGFTQYLSMLSHTKDNKNLIIRFNGGHQAGHTVVYNKTKHVFSSFGSGTLIGDTTFWSKFCTVFPPALFNEYHVLKEKGVTPKIIFDALCPVTTPYDVYSNRQVNDKTKHGSVGVGFGSTIKRQEDYYKLHYQDLFNRTVTQAKLDSIKSYYEKIHGHAINIEDQIDIWYKCIESLIADGIMTEEKISIYTNGVENYNNIIFEGAQGILLDMDHGFFPNVTRSNTTTKNIYTLMADLGVGFRTQEKLKIFYITRCYQTRHGNGFMSNENLIPDLVNTENEINVDSSYQGKFRKSLLDLDLIKYALRTDNINNTDYYTGKKHIIVTCVDQLPEGNISYTRDGVVYTKSINNFKETLKIESGLDIYISSKEGVFEYTEEAPTIQSFKIPTAGVYGRGDYAGTQGTSGAQGYQSTGHRISAPSSGKSGSKIKYPAATSVKLSKSASKIPVSTKFTTQKKGR